MSHDTAAIGGDRPDDPSWGGGPQVHDRADNVCVIGAGAAGLTAIKNLREYGFGVDCFERDISVGGAWNWRSPRSPVYASTHLISSKPFTQYPDFPMPDSWPDYPHHAQVHAYLERYADHFGLREHIWFGTEVTSVEPTGDGRWDVTTSGGASATRTRRYAAVAIANGHNWAAKMPAYDGMSDFRGEIIHASQYKDAAQLRGKRVLVIGAGNTGCDLAVEAAQQAARCWHSSRRGYWYAPKYAYGRPSDQVNDLVLSLGLPLRVRQWLFHRTMRRTVGDLTRFGLPKPDHRIYETHPIANSQLVYYLGHGSITSVPEVARFTRDTVQFVDGREVEPELVILATGYLPRFEFLAPDVLNVDSDGRPRLYLHTFSPAYPTLGVIGLLQPDSGVFGLMHWQSVLFAAWLRLRESAPDQAASFWRRHHREVSGRFNKAKVKESTRHWFEIGHVDYLKALDKTLREMETAL